MFRNTAKCTSNKNDFLDKSDDRRSADYLLIKVTGDENEPTTPLR
jgi:hypothetical protein